MLSSLILVRHAAVSIDPAIPSHKWPLTADGRSATHQLAHQLKPYQPSRIITSEEAKAQATGQALADVWSLPVQPAPGLQEHDRRGVPYFENRADFETAVTNFFARPDELVFGRETAVAAAARFSQAVMRQVAANPDHTLAIVAHGTVLTLFICQHNPHLLPRQFWQSLTLPCAFILSLPELKLIKSFLANGKK